MDGEKRVMVMESDAKCDFIQKLLLARIRSSKLDAHDQVIKVLPLETISIITSADEVGEVMFFLIKE